MNLPRHVHHRRGGTDIVNIVAMLMPDLPGAVYIDEKHSAVEHTSRPLTEIAERGFDGRRDDSCLRRDIARTDDTPIILGDSLRRRLDNIFQSNGPEVPYSVFLF